jgi:single-strand DNA-binding protein
VGADRRVGKDRGVCAASTLSKGRQVLVEGRLQTREWTNKEGNKQYTTEVVADRVLFLGGGNGEDRGARAAIAAAATTGSGDESFGRAACRPATRAAVVSPAEDDIPF